MAPGIRQHQTSAERSVLLPEVPLWVAGRC